MPRVFIISSHGSMPMIDVAEPVVYQVPIFAAAAARKAKKKTKTNLVSSAADPAPDPAPDPALAIRGLTIKKPDYFKVPVDTFTTAKCGQPFCADLRCDAPYVGLVHILSQYRLPSDVSKETVRQIIKKVMLDIKRDPRHADSLTRAENKIRCHKTGRRMTELFLFGPSHELPIVESVTMVDMKTGEIQDAHAMFGLVEKHASTSRPYAAAAAAAQFVDYGMAGLQYAKQRAEWDLRTLQGAAPFYIEMKKNHIKTIDDTIEGVLRESKFEYAPELKAEYGDRVKLSGLLKIGVENRVIDPKNDFVVVYACRVPDERVPPGVIDSPHGSDGSDSDVSVGGTRTRSKQKQKGKNKQRYRRKTCKRRN
jgi:hypothetical protein